MHIPAHTIAGFDRSLRCNSIFRDDRETGREEWGNYFAGNYRKPTLRLFLSHCHFSLPFTFSPRQKVHTLACPRLICWFAIAWWTTTPLIDRSKTAATNRARAPACVHVVHFYRHESSTFFLYRLTSRRYYSPRNRMRLSSYFNRSASCRIILDRYCSYFYRNNLAKNAIHTVYM